MELGKLSSRPPEIKSKSFAYYWRDRYLARRRRGSASRLSVAHKLILFAVVPSMFVWSVVWALALGNIRAAVLVVCAFSAGAIVGWFCHAVTHEEG